MLRTYVLFFERTIGSTVDAAQREVVLTALQRLSIVDVSDLHALEERIALLYFLENLCNAFAAIERECDVIRDGRELRNRSQSLRCRFKVKQQRKIDQDNTRTMGKIKRLTYRRMEF